MESKPRLIKIIINRLFGLVVAFYLLMIGGSAAGAGDDIIRALESAGTLSLGSWLTIIKDKFDDEDEKKKPDELEEDWSR